jgi:hypothetical protein
MRQRRVSLLDPFRLPGALVPGVRMQFDDIAHEPVPARLAALARRADRLTDGAGDESLDRDGRNAAADERLKH